ncbi:MAG: helix-turn-helix transcriptional regulator, partial [Myxococcota bacterium]
MSTQLTSDEVNFSILSRRLRAAAKADARSYQELADVLQMSASHIKQLVYGKHRSIERYEELATVLGTSVHELLLGPAAAPSDVPLVHGTLDEIQHAEDYDRLLGNLRDLVHRDHRTYEQIADAAGMSRSYLQKILNGKRRAPQQMQAIAEVLGTTVDAIEVSEQLAERELDRDQRAYLGGVLRLHSIARGLSIEDFEAQAGIKNRALAQLYVGSPTQMERYVHVVRTLGLSLSRVLQEASELGDYFSQDHYPCANFGALGATLQDMLAAHPTANRVLAERMNMSEGLLRNLVKADRQTNPMSYIAAFLVLGADPFEVFASVYDSTPPLDPPQIPTILDAAALAADAEPKSKPGPKPGAHRGRTSSARHAAFSPSKPPTTSAPSPTTTLEALHS